MKANVRGATADEIGSVLEFIESQMGAPREYFDSRFQTCPPANPEDSRIVVVDGQIISHIRIYRRDLRLRGAVIPTGHLSEVCTHSDFRRRGYGRALLRDCIAYIGSLGFPLSCVWSGVTQFYPCEGWVRFPLISTSLHVPLWRRDLPLDVYVRRYRRGSDDPAVAEIYEEYNRDRNLSAVRNAEYWRLHHSWRGGEDESGFLIAERGGRAVGYCRYSRDQMIEYGVQDGHDDAGGALIDALVRRKRRSRNGGNRLSLTLPADETVITRDPQLRYERSLNEHMLMRIIDLKGILDIALHTSGERLKAIGFMDRHTIPIEVLGQKCAIRLEGGKASAEALPETAPATPLAQAEFFKLIFGATVERDLSGFSREDRHLLNDLFPPDGPVYWTADVT